MTSKLKLVAAGAACAIFLASVPLRAAPADEVSRNGPRMAFRADNKDHDSLPALTNAPRDGAALAQLQGTAQPPAATPQFESALLALFGDVFERVRNDYVEKPDDTKLLTAAGRAMLKAFPSARGRAAIERMHDATCSAAASAASRCANVYVALNDFGEILDGVWKDNPAEDNGPLIIAAALNGMLASLDPHSSYMDAKTFRDLLTKPRSKVAELGLEVTLDAGLTRITALNDQAPAGKAGLKTNDIIVRIDGTPVGGLTLEQIIDRLHGPVNGLVRLTIQRPGGTDPLLFTLIRDAANLPSVTSHLERNVAYVRISRLDEKATESLKTTIGDLNRQIATDALKGYVLDLRNNPGGLLDQSISIADAFLERGEIVSTRARKAEDTQRFNARPGELTGGKLIVVLINGGTASGAEIIAGALKDHKRATLLGSRSFGNGSIQTILPLGAGKGALRLTTARFFTPSGRAIEAAGIDPDIEILQEEPDDIKAKGDARNLRSYVPSDPADDKALNAALDLLNGTLVNPAFPPNPNAATAR